MFFESVDEILAIAGRSGASVFVVPDAVKVEIKNALVLKPEEKSVITIEQVRDVMARVSVKQARDQYVLVRPAEALGEEAANAFLKSLEEPGDKVHFVLVTSSPSQLLPTILSRCAVYFLRSHEAVDGDIHADEKIKDVARRLLVARPADFPGLAEEITKKKEGVRAHALEVLGVTIEMLYKSYFKTGKMVFVQKLPKFLTAYENIEQNGHVKLHLVADLL